MISSDKSEFSKLLLLKFWLALGQDKVALDKFSRVLKVRSLPYNLGGTGMPVFREAKVAVPGSGV